jgi:hypothetical protein
MLLATAMPAVSFITAGLCSLSVSAESKGHLIILGFHGKLHNPGQAGCWARRTLCCRAVRNIAFSASASDSELVWLMAIR